MYMYRAMQVTNMGNEIVTQMLPNVWKIQLGKP